MKGTLHKMRTQALMPVRYELSMGDEQVGLNDLLGRHVHLAHTGLIYCIQCGRQTKKSFQQGFCFPCYRRLNECNLCMIHPERCRHDVEKCKPDDWVHASCMVPHVVYLANSSGLKVGITRQSQVPTRWMDQGAIQAIPIFSTQNRFQAGTLEVAFKKFVADKTNWRTMLTQQNPKIELMAERQRLLQEAAAAIEKVQAEFPEGDIQLLSEEIMQEFYYPVIEYPQKLRVFNLDKNPTVSGHLQGIKGQYLIFDEGVINVRKYGGYEITLGAGCCG
jgi:hypothetical protein